MRGVFVTGTDTGAGKTVLAGAICAALVARGQRVAAFKPVVTGLDELGRSAARSSIGRAPHPAPSPGEWPHDHELLATASGGRPDEVTPYTFGPAVSPHWAAELERRPIEPARLVSTARAAGRDADVLVCEGVGGLLVPLTTGYSVRDLAVDLGLPLVVAARPGLGTINHTLLTVEAARAVGLRVTGVVMTPWPADPEPIAVSNRETVEQLAAVPVSGLPPATPDSLAAVAATLPIDDWL